jgi:release factor glutamine methyltransferase
MRKIIKGIVNRTWKPFVERYLQKTRVYHFRDMAVAVPPGVFHPGFFFSTKLLISFLEKQNLKGKSFLEMGSGSGLVSIFAAKQHATVTACDISPASVLCTTENAKRNNVTITVLQSDLFSAILPQQFDFIAVNPPYFKKHPASIAENAWYCGENLEYFRRFFQQAAAFLAPSSAIIMVLSDECDLRGIQAIALENRLSFEQVLQKRTAWETGFIFNIRRSEK